MQLAPLQKLDFSKMPLHLPLLPVLLDAKPAMLQLPILALLPWLDSILMPQLESLLAQMEKVPPMVILEPPPPVLIVMPQPQDFVETAKHKAFAQPARPETF